MEQLAINEMTTYRWSFEEDVRNYSKAGIKGIGIWRQKLSDFGEDKGAELLGDCGLSVSSLLWAGGFTGSDGRSYKESIEDARAAIELASTLKANCLVVYTGGRGGHTHKHARRLIATALGEIAAIAADFNTILALEPMHIGCAADWTFLTSLEDSIELLNSIDNAQLKLVFDAYHLGLDPNAIKLIPEIAQRVALVQLGDAKSPPKGEQNRCRLGDGVIPLAQIVQAFLQSGYEDFFEVELMGEDVEGCDCDSLLEHSKRSFTEITNTINV